MGIKAVGTMATSEFLQALLEELIPEFYSVQTNNVDTVRFPQYNLRNSMKAKALRLARTRHFAYVDDRSLPKVVHTLKDIL